jgi:hypothetical protein
MANLPYTAGFNGNGIMDSFIVDSTDASLRFVAMLLERMDGVEDKCSRLETEVARLTAEDTANKADNATLRAQNTTLEAELAAQPRPQAYYTWLRVPDHTSREQVEDGLKAKFAHLQLTTDGVFRTGFHVAVTTAEDEESGAYLYMDAHVFIYGALGITPLQAQTWATSAVQGSRLTGTRVRMIWQDAEVEWFMQQVRGDRTYALYPRFMQHVCAATAHTCCTRGVMHGWRRKWSRCATTMTTQTARLGWSRPTCTASPT